MKSSYYRIWDFIDLEWHDPLWTPLPQYAQKFHYFRTSADDLGRAPVRLIVRSGKPPQALRQTIVTVAERFGLGDGIMETRSQNGRMRFTSWVAGLERDTVKIWYDFPILNRLQGTTALFPDFLMAFDVIQPVIEYKLQQLGVAVLHAGAFSMNGKAVLLAGRGGAKKSTYLIEAVRRGAEFLADDLILLKDGVFYAYPMCDTYFDYFYRYEDDETVDLKSMLGAFRHIRRDRPLAFPVAPPTPAGEVVLLIESSRACSAVTEIGTVDDAALERLLANDRLEKLNCGDEEEARGRFLLHFGQHYGINAWERYWMTYQEQLRRSLSGLPFKVILSGRRTVLTDVLPASPAT